MRMGGPSSSDANDNIRHFSTFFDIQPGAIKPPAVLYLPGMVSWLHGVFVGHFWPGNNRVTNDKNFSEFMRLEI